MRSQHHAKNYSLPDVLERIYDNRLALEAAIMELTRLLEELGSQNADRNIRESWKESPTI